MGTMRSATSSWRGVPAGVLLLVGLGTSGCAPGAAERNRTRATFERWTRSPCAADAETGQSGWSFSTDVLSDAHTSQLFVGNGYLGLRLPALGAGYAEGREKSGWPLYERRYTGAYVAGLYGRGAGNPKNKRVIAALPTWSALWVNVAGEWLTPTTPRSSISRYRQTLNLRCGLARTAFRWTPVASARATDVVYEVFTDRANPHVGLVRVLLTPRWSGELLVTDALDGSGARRLRSVGGIAKHGDSVVVAFRTVETDTLGAVASTLRGGHNAPSLVTMSRRSDGLSASRSVKLKVRTGRTYELIKYVGVDTELTAKAPIEAAMRASKAAAARGWARTYRAHVTAWTRLLRGRDIVVVAQPRMQRWVRGAQYALLASARAGQDTSIAPAGLSSDDYAGLIFWDAETWIFPALLLTHPEIARSILEYRYKTRGAARDNAKRLGLAGTLYPWTSAASGRMETDCRSGPVHCLGQLHLQSDVALAAWQYYLATGDHQWLESRGWPLIRGVAEFWSVRVSENDDGSFSLRNVAGPDEYSNGVNDGVFTNAGVSRTLRVATKAAALLGKTAPSSWTKIAHKLRIPFDKKRRVFLQHASYAGTKIKQADAVLLRYPLEWPMSDEVAAKMLHYYAPRTDPDGPAMTDSIHAIAAASIGVPGCSTYTYLARSVRPFVRAPYAQLAEARGERSGAEAAAGAPAFTFHTAAGGFLQTFAFGLAGFRWRDGSIYLNPTLPPQLRRGVLLRGIRYRGSHFDIHLGAKQTKVLLRSGPPLVIEHPEGKATLRDAVTLPTRRPDLAPSSNVARCANAAASSEEPGYYAEAATDGDEATLWRPKGMRGTLTVDLRKERSLSRARIVWERPAAASARLWCSRDGTSFFRAVARADGQLAASVRARFFRVEVEPSPAGGIRELVLEP